MLLNLQKLHYTFQFPSTEKFKYMQIILSTVKPLPGLPTPFKRYCKRDPHAKGTISHLYHLLLHGTASPKDSYMDKWHCDIDDFMTHEYWGDVWTTTKSCSMNELAMEVHYKLLMRRYITPHYLKMFNTMSDGLCFRGCRSQGTSIHIWWDYPVVQTF